MIAYPAQGVTYVLFTSTRATYGVLVAQSEPATRFADGTARVYMRFLVACISELFIVIVVGFAVIMELSYCKSLELSATLGQGFGLILTSGLETGCAGFCS